MTEPKNQSLSRRTFVQTTAAATAGLVIPGPLRAAYAVAPPGDVLRIGVVGCGGRGTGAARDAMRGSERVEVVALGDLFPDRLASCRAALATAVAEDATLAPKYKVTDERCFAGFDAYQKVLASGIDLVILATPPGFRPAHLDAAVAAGKHIFTEKPVAVDAAGIRSVLASAEAAKRKGLAVVAGTQRRHDAGYRATIERVRGGAIGEIVGGQVYWNQGGLWNQPRKPEWSDAEWQIRNWLYFTWLSGDHIVEQHVHNIDVANWVMGGPPARAMGVGGRQRRTGPEYGHVYDHFAIELVYPSGARVLSMCRQMDGTASQVGERFVGTKGSTNASAEIWGASQWRYEPKPPNPYVQEHTNLVASIRAGTPLNELRQVAESTLTAIMAREAAYTGQEVTWDEMLNAPQTLTPPVVAFGPLPTPPVPMPGQTKLARGWNEA